MLDPINHKYVNIASDILRLSKLCFANGKTINGRLWNEGNDLIRQKHNIDIDTWLMIRKDYVQPVLDKLKEK